MPRLITIDLDHLSAETRNRVMAERREAMKNPRYVMALAEAADLYGFSYQTIRTYTSSGRIACSGKVAHTGKPGIRHRDMRKYLHSRKATGCKRTALKAAQSAIDVPKMLGAMAERNMAFVRELEARIDAQRAKRKGKMAIAVNCKTKRTEA